MSEIDLIFPNIAISTISVAITSITIAFIIAIVLQSIYELGLRKYLNSDWFTAILSSSKFSRYEGDLDSHTVYKFGSNVIRVCREYSISLKEINKKLIENLRNGVPDSILSLPPTQLAGQISVMLDTILMDALAEHFKNSDFHREIKDEDNFNYVYQTIRTSYEPLLDSIQIDLYSYWQKTDLVLSAISAFVMSLVFVLASSISWKIFIIFILVLVAALFVAMKFKQNLEYFFVIIFVSIFILFLFSGAFSWITVSFIIPVLMVPQARVLVERVLRIR